MKLGISTWAYAWAIGVPEHLPLRPMNGMDFVRCAAGLGLKVVQIADNQPLDRMREDHLVELLAETERLGLEVEVGTRGIRPGHLRAYLRLARRFGSPIVRTIVDSAGHQPSLDEAVELIREIMPEFERAGVTLAVENHDRFTAREFQQIVLRVNSPNCGICLDTVNSFGALEGPEVVVETLAPYVVNLHLKDFSIRRADHTMGFIIEGKPAGEGRLNIPWLLDLLKRHGRDCNAILENWPPPEATVEDTILKEHEWAVRGVNHLRTLIAD